MRILIVLTGMCACLGAGVPAVAAQHGGGAVLVAHEAKQCTLRLMLPANWTLEEKSADGACVVTAREPAHDSRCGKTGDDKTLCDAERQAIVSIRPGSIDEAGTWERSDIYPFYREAGQWRFLNGHLSERDAVLLQGKPRKILYADYATREYYDDGSYCCAGRNWWALVDLPEKRIAVVQLTWDFIAWDDDTSAWTDATDAQAKSNAEQFLKALR